MLSSVELFAGGGGLALGLERAGFEHALLNDVDLHACATLRLNRPQWKVSEGEVSELNFAPFSGITDLITGGFPCQAFSLAGKGRGFEDYRGTLFFEFARAIKEIQPKMFMAENVKGLRSHDNGRTLWTMTQVLRDLGYELEEVRVLNAADYGVPQTRERLFILGVRRDLWHLGWWDWPQPLGRRYSVRDALKAGKLYPVDVPPSAGAVFPAKRAEILEQVPQGGYWRDLPRKVWKDYMGVKFDPNKGGSTGCARRLAWNFPSLTLLCTPSQKLTERCHPAETRPLTTREYARIQTFPDDWIFSGSMVQQYKQIGNAVPVKLAEALGRSLADALKRVL